EAGVSQAPVRCVLSASGVPGALRLAARRAQRGSGLSRRSLRRVRRTIPAHALAWGGVPRDPAEPHPIGTAAVRRAGVGAVAAAPARPARAHGAAHRRGTVTVHHRDALADPADLPRRADPQLRRSGGARSLAGRHLALPDHARHPRSPRTLLAPPARAHPTGRFTGPGTTKGSGATTCVSLGVGSWSLGVGSWELAPWELAPHSVRNSSQWHAARAASRRA